MPETSWSEEEAAPPKKPGIPTWLWFCGGGCLALVVLAVIAIGLIWTVGRKMMDPETQWQRVERMLRYAERPPELKPRGGIDLGAGIDMEEVRLEDSRGFMVTLQHHGGKRSSESRKKMFGGVSPEFPQNLMVMKFRDLSQAVVEVQGRELHVLRMRMEFSGWMKSIVPKDAQDQLGSMAFVDLTPEGEEGLLMLQMMKLKGAEPVSDEEIRELLKPFHVGPKR